MGEIYYNAILAFINFVLAAINFILVLKNGRFIQYLVGVLCAFMCLYGINVSINLYDSRMTEEREEKAIEGYYEIKNTIEEIKTSDKIVNKSEILFAIRPKIDKVNEIIDEHKSHCNSWWDGYRYSEKIGNLEKFE